MLLIIDRCGNKIYNGKYYFNNLDKNQCPIFYKPPNKKIDADDTKTGTPFIFYRLVSNEDNGETVWAISSKNSRSGDDENEETR